MSGLLKQKNIIASIQKFWNDQNPLSITTVYPGMKTDTTHLSEWLELWVEPNTRPVQRSVDYPELKVTVTVHCFVTPGDNRARIHEIADVIRGMISQKTIEILDYDLSGNPVTGYLRLQEEVIRNRTRKISTQFHISMQHLVLKCDGLAQSI